MLASYGFPKEAEHLLDTAQALPSSSVSRSFFSSLSTNPCPRCSMLSALLSGADLTPTSSHFLSDRIVHRYISMTRLWRLSSWETCPD